MIQFFKDLFKYTKRVYFTKAFDLQSQSQGIAMHLTFNLIIVLYMLWGGLLEDGGLHLGILGYYLLVYRLHFQSSLAFSHSA